MQLTLKSSDDQTFTVDRGLLKHAGTIENLITSMNLDDSEETPSMPIPLPNVRGAILKLVINWLTLHKDEPVAVEKEEEEVKGEKSSDDISKEDREFVKLFAQDVIFELLLAANYLDIKGLLVVCCKTIANMVKACKDSEAIRRKFGIANDFTKEEQEQIEKENKWCEE